MGPTPEEAAEIAELEAAEEYAVLHENDFLLEAPEWRIKMHEFALGQPFEIFIAAIIIMNVITMAMEHYNMSDNFKLFLQVTNYIFTAIFVIEMVAKQISLGLARYHCGLQRHWNNFDVFIVFISVLGILIEDVIGSDNVPIDPSMLKVLRILRVARILKLLKNAKDLVVLLTVVARSLAQVGNLALLLFLLFFIYAALGIELFGKICTDDTLYECDSIGSFAHFRNFGMAMLLLFRLSTGDNWNGVLKDAMLEAPYCDDQPLEDCDKNCCANSTIAPLYFISFTLLSTFVMLNLVIAVLMAELEDASDGGSEAEEECGDDVPNALVNGDDSKDGKKAQEAKAPDAHPISNLAKSDVTEPASNAKVGGESEEENTDSLEQQVREVLGPEAESEPGQGKEKKKMEHLEAELEDIVANAPVLPPLPHQQHQLTKVNSNPTTPGRPSSFVPFAPALVVPDEPEVEGGNVQATTTQQAAESDD